LNRNRRQRKILATALAAEWQLRVDLAACYRLVARFGWDDLIFTHVSARVPGPDSVVAGLPRL
jgi:ribulose-5-phosphate 4-epimerase/fuculose-1-phosphate aldolase